MDIYRCVHRRQVNGCCFCKICTMSYVHPIKNVDGEEEEEEMRAQGLTKESFEFERCELTAS